MARINLLGDKTVLLARCAPKDYHNDQESIFFCTFLHFHHDHLKDIYQHKSCPIVSSLSMTVYLDVHFLFMNNLLRCMFNTI